MVGVALSPRVPVVPKAHHLFELLKLQRIFVTRFGELVGAVSRVEVRGGQGGEKEALKRGGHKEGDKEQAPTHLPCPLAVAESD